MGARIAACLCALAATVVSAQIKQTPLTGTWQITGVKGGGPNGKTNNNPQPGFYMFTGTHFSVMMVGSDAPRPDDIPPGPVDESKVTFRQLAAAWASFAAYGGTYSLSGDTLTVQAHISKSPRPMTRKEMIVFSYKLDGDKLTLVPIRDSNGPMTNPATTTLKRIE